MVLKHISVFRELALKAFEVMLKNHTQNEYIICYSNMNRPET
jgi:hypothetical protein